MNYKSYHVPVLLFPILNYFGVNNQSIILDGTLGFGGHASELLLLAPNACYIGFDRDKFALNHAKELCGEYSGFSAVNQSYSSMFQYCKEKSIKCSHLLLDLGVSSFQIDQSERGFTFQKDEPLDMRMDQHALLTAKEVLATYSDAQLIHLFSEEGDIKNSQKLVSNIMIARDNNKLDTSFQLLDCIKRAFFFKSRSHYIAMATKVFQAIRVEVNNEMGELKSILADLLTVSDITVAIITFQPNEDRLVKSFIKENKLECVQKKPFMASYNECRQNPREKSAKLRIFYV